MYPDTVLLDLPEVMPTARAANEPLTAEPPAASSSEKKYAAFRIAGRLFAVDAGSVSEIVLPTAVTPLPHTASFILGITEISGNLASVIDLQNLLFGTNHHASAWTKMIVLRSEADGDPIAFPVEKLVEMMRFDADSISPFADEAAPMIIGQAERGGEIIYFVDAARLAADLFTRLSD